nr:MAG TPA: hypothetical protein [Caudoviricetes sp.]DAU51011.1 MAG TPA: hypothetical protein [Caudoviricetes sp.]
MGAGLWAVRTLRLHQRRATLSLHTAESGRSWDSREHLDRLPAVPCGI